MVSVFFLAEHGKILDEFFLSTAGKSGELFYSELGYNFLVSNAYLSMVYVEKFQTEIGKRRQPK